MLWLHFKEKILIVIVTVIITSIIQINNTNNKQRSLSHIPSIIEINNTNNKMANGDHPNASVRDSINTETIGISAI